MKRMNGFTLVELMITVACIAILAALAFPSYSEYMRRARRTDAKNAVLEVAGRQERFYSIHNRYAKTAAELGYAALPAVVQSSGGSSYYQLSVDFIDDAKSYSVKAVPQGSQTKDLKCYTYVLAHTGAQSNVDGGGSRLTGASCW
ncbi:type IV pilin protein [Diaphorobacter aerolatus]|uniref:Type IV pilin protein n=1 Tax=Diaphorobacter aerolatus TaxID=1288495 RepID=A0A7H0GFS7_9BURK|nr:type IV pilin protein [Diaphorobacter aerolatus]QNP47143.1 type IV pilin protein [Diaphorobacter aerolatus]